MFFFYERSITSKSLLSEFFLKSIFKRTMNLIRIGMHVFSYERLQLRNFFIGRKYSLSPITFADLHNCVKYLIMFLYCKSSKIINLYFYLVFRLLLRFGSIQSLRCVQPRFAFIRSFRRASLSQRKITATVGTQGWRQRRNGGRTHGRKRLERYCHWWWAFLAQYQRSQQKIEGKRVAKRDNRKVKTKAANLEEQKICHRVSFSALNLQVCVDYFTHGLKPHHFIGFFYKEILFFPFSHPFYIRFCFSHSCMTAWKMRFITSTLGCNFLSFD